MTNGQRFFLLAMTFFFFLFVKNVIQLLFNMENDDIHRKRLRELNFEGTRIGQSEDDETKAFLNKVTAPIVSYLLPKIKYRDNDELGRALKFTGWDKLMNVPQFRALDIILKGVGIIAFVLLFNFHKLFAIAWLIIPFFSLKFFLKNTANNKKDKMFSEFPEFIRLTQGYLTAEMTLTEAIENTIDYVGDEWKPYLRQFSVNARIKSVRDALFSLQQDIDIFEVRELFSLIRVSLDQGVDVKDSFETQTDKVRSMQLEIMMKKIEKRKMMAIALQAPLLLTIIVSFALPTMEAMVGF